MFAVADTLKPELVQIQLKINVALTSNSDCGANLLYAASNESTGCLMPKNPVVILLAI